MKKTLVIFFFLLAAGGYGKAIKTEEVPAPISLSFQQSYPQASNAKWKLKKGRYKVKFDFHGTRMEVVFNPDGSIRKTTVVKGGKP